MSLVPLVLTPRPQRQASRPWGPGAEAQSLVAPENSADGLRTAVGPCHLPAAASRMHTSASFGPAGPQGRTASRGPFSASAVRFSWAFQRVMMLA